ncbi:MAG: 2-(1,2-epoxy,2-dihydrophenyl)acetyl-CoA isomerase [Alphaproteobacteria bacterium]|nr:2-(1,2-epoxy,2-dihydrophenyl)acetyl-CoA isomerase [Alphaproteobacteria bacterium]
MPAEKAMRLERNGGLARLTFTDPDRGNPIDGRFCSELAEVAALLATDRDLRCVLVAAEGRAFSYGGDISSFVGKSEELPSIILRWTTTFHSAIARMQRIDAPIVAMVHGMCAGGMAGFVAGCDLVVAAPKASFYAAYPGIGFSCDGGSSIMYARRMGPARARRFLLLDEKLDASQALAVGLVDEVVPADELVEKAEALAARLASGPTKAFGEMRRLLLSVSDQPLETQLEREAQALARIAATADAQEGLAAFAAKRPPRFQGR